MPYILNMLTVIETATFQHYAETVFTELERMAFINWLSMNPLSGDVIVGSGGLRKVRWRRFNVGKSGGLRVIYYTHLQKGEIYLLIAYTKSKFDNLPLPLLLDLKKDIYRG